MRFMMLMIPGGYGSAAPDAMPSAEAVKAMMKYNEELKKAGVLLALEGAASAVLGGAGHLQGRTADHHRWPLPGGQGSAGRVLDYRCALARRGHRMGPPLPCLER